MSNYDNIYADNDFSGLELDLDGAPESVDIEPEPAPKLELDLEPQAPASAPAPVAPAPMAPVGQPKMTDVAAEKVMGATKDQADMFLADVAGKRYTFKPAHYDAVVAFMDAYAELPHKPTKKAMAQCVEASGLPADLMPNDRSNKHYAGQACRRLAFHELGMDCVAEKRCKERGYDAGWHLGSKMGLADADTEIGSPYGSKSVIVKLLDEETGELAITGDETVANMIRDEYNRTRWARVYSSTERKEWARAIMVNHFGAVALEVSRKPIPLTSCDSLAAAVANGLISEINAIRTDIDNQIKNAHNRGATLGARAATNAVSRLETVAEKAKSLDAVLVGDEADRAVKAASALISFLGDYCDATTMRGAFIWDEIRRESCGL